MKEPSVSIYMATYNHEQYVHQAIESILMQEVNFTYEIVIGDDFSTDSTPLILKKYKQLYPEIINLKLRNKNIGATANSWDLKKMCKGKYIALLEGDDFWNCKYKLQRQFDILENNENFIAVAHNIYRCDEDGENISEYSYSISEGIIKMEDLIHNGLLYHTSTLMHRNLYTQSSDKYKKLLTSHSMIGDYPLSVLLLSMGNIILLKERYSTHRVIIKPLGTNAKSVAKRNVMRSVISQLEQVFLIEEFFDFKYELENKKILLVLTLWYSFFPRVSNHTKTDRIEAREVLKKIDSKIKLKAFIRGLIYLSKKMLSLFKK